jgi:hypothetical protein
MRAMGDGKQNDEKALFFVLPIAVRLLPIDDFHL